MTTSLSGRRIAVAVSGSDIGQTLAASLAQCGAKVVLLCDRAGLSDAAHAFRVADFSSRAALETAFQDAAATLGGIDLVVHAALPEASLRSRSLGEMEDEDWQAACETALDASFHCLQAAHPLLAASAGMLVQIGPSLALLGASGLVALTTAAEAQRGLAKSAARQWGSDGIRVVWISVAADQLSPLLAAADLPKKSEAIPIPLGARPTLEGDVTAMIASLAGEAGARVTGLTLNLDGGEWMLP